MLNILTEPLIRVTLTSGAADSVSLPETYARLMADAVAAFPALRPHQRHAWHAFLCQLAAMALHRAGQSEPPADTEAWAILLRGLTPEWPQDEPWQLVVEDLTRPAFMQPPAGSAAKTADYKSRVDTPDELDMLVTSKNHDLKGAVVSVAQADDWLFALLTLQTMEGFSGAGNYGIAKMNGGMGNRPAFSLTPSARLGAHIRRDIAALLECRPALLADYPMTSGGMSLLWTLPWDGTAPEALTLNKVEPFYIEVCRRLRLHNDAGRLYARRASSKAARMAAKASKGLAGDPWALIDRRDKKGDKVLTLQSGGFTYRRVSGYLDPANWETPPLLQLTPAEEKAGQGMQLVARATVRGQGKTEGYYERVIPLRPKAALAVGMRRGAAAPADELGNIARERVVDVGKVQRILSHAISVFAARGDASKVSAEHRKVTPPFLKRLDQIVEAGFFDDLQTEFEAAAAERKNIRDEWQRNTLVANARQILNAAADSLPCPAIYRYKARVNANGLLEGRLRNSKDGFPGLLDYPGGTE